MAGSRLSHMAGLTAKVAHSGGPPDAHNGTFSLKPGGHLAAIP
jgi:hypothetical protein